MSGQRIAITGSSGLIGGALSAFLRARGDTVVRIVRRAPVPPFEVALPKPGDDVAALSAALADVDAVVNLAGAGIADHRWSSSYKQALRTSRLETTASLVQAMGRLERPIRLVSGSAVGYYGDRDEEVLVESSAAGSDFLADLTVSWERENEGASAAGHSVALARTGLVASARAGAFRELFRPARLGLAGPLGTGQQWWSWISLRDEVRALAFLIDHPSIIGPVNLVAPRAARQKDIAQSFARALRRPAVVPVPAPLLRVVLGEMSTQILASTRVRPAVLDAAGFTWLDSNQDQTIDRLVFDLTRGSRR